jgi:hypothetical protein
MENVIILLKFVPHPDNADIEKLSSYLYGSSFCFFAARMTGGAGENGYDYSCHLLFNTKQQFNLQFRSFLNTFRDLIAHYQVYKSNITKEIPRALPFTHELEGVRTTNSLNKDNPDYVQSLIIQSVDDNVRDIIARFNQS